VTVDAARSSGASPLAAGASECRTPEQQRSMRLPALRAAQGAGLSFGAPLGWLATRVAAGASPTAELARHAGLYAYLALATAAAFAAFGWLLGLQERRLRELLAKLEELATTDPLTGLYNRRFFDERLRLESALAERGTRPLALVMFDIDGFKQVNDRFGHATGDRVLEVIGSALRASTRTGEVAARIGGEELALLLPGCSLDEGRQAAERVRALALAAMRREEALPPSAIPTMSAGVAYRYPSTGGPAGLMADADRALYAAKRQGRDRVEVVTVES
jgi:diguanylate cyclase (GGDEF)-like protein